MKDLYDLRETLMDGLEEFDTVKGHELKMGELEALNLLTDTVKNIDKICLMDEDGEYSQAGDWEMEGRGRGSYGDGTGYSSRRGRSRNGRYSRDGRYPDDDGMPSYRGRKRDSMGRYSRDGAKEDMMEHIEEMMDSAPDDRTREMIRSFKKEIERA